MRPSIVLATAGKFVAVALVVSFVALSVSQSAVAGTTSPRPVHVDRDHRGDKDTTTYVRDGLKPPGAKRDPGWGNYGKGKGDGPIVRDHRH